MNGMIPARLAMALTAAIFFAASAHATAIVEEGAYVRDPRKKELAGFMKNRELTVDHVTREGYEVYGPRGLRDWLDLIGVEYYVEARDDDTAAYPSPEAVAKRLQDLHAAYPSITKLMNLGKSALGRELLIMKISDNPEVDEPEPEVKYISSMHGDEITGRELMMSLIEDLVKGYGKDERIAELVDNTEIFIMPSMNPDGSFARQRANANGADLNRDFPDFSTDDNQNTPENRQPETQALMRFQAARHFALSANFHGGAEVVNYPWDTTPELHPQDALVKGLSLAYASKVPYMRDSSEFPGGITNGYAWYEVNGGMQDWSSFWYGDLQVTIELSGAKWPDYGAIPRFYRDNKDALLEYLEAVHQGAGFRVAGKPGASGRVEIVRLVDGQSLGTFGFSGSEFYKVLDPGRYRFIVEPNGGDERSLDVEVEASRIFANGNYVTF
ncbi:MAG: succinylglutamate desuccinylase/aspartoacylase family protein [Deltaproteobacteria bacterium]|nr:succinylglutamate desuccinylase/aspartoacylase family protein [Deltaproteobacteria bacterium]